MIEITNRTSGPVQVLVRSRRKARAFTSLTIPGRGSGCNVKVIPDELYTEHIDRVERWKFISTRRISNK